jgi:uncharacterized protein
MIRSIRKVSVYLAIALAILWLTVTPVWSSFVPKEKSLFWEVSGNGLAQPSYLFGTIHIQCKDKLNWPASRQAYWDQAEQLYLEIDFDDPQMTSEILSNIQMPEGQTLRKVLGEKKYRRAKKFFTKQTKMDLDMFSTIRPFFLSTLILPTGLKCKTDSWEETLTTMAKQRQLPLAGLETVKEQLSVFDRLSLKEEAEILMATVDYPKVVEKEFQQLLRAYNRQDLKELQRLSEISTDATSRKLNKFLLDDRNEKWIPKIASAATEKPTFFGFGAAHLVGKKGVIALLRQAGYTVKPIS